MDKTKKEKDDNLHKGRPPISRAMNAVNQRDDKWYKIQLMTAFYCNLKRLHLSNFLTNNGNYSSINNSTRKNCQVLIEPFNQTFSQNRPSLTFVKKIIILKIVEKYSLTVGLFE